MNCNFSNGMLCVLSGDAKCDGDNDRSGCPFWKIAFAIRPEVKRRPINKGPCAVDLQEGDGLCS